jgi:predicted phosphodiesterase
MRLGILSDTHDQIERTRAAIGLLRDAGAEALIHCGDLACPVVVELLAVLPSWFVFGSHDADVAPQLERVAAERGVACLGWGGTIEFAGKRVGVVHGPCVRTCVACWSPDRTTYSRGTRTPRRTR